MTRFEEMNVGLKTTDIKGKAYVEVNERIKAFRKMFPDGFIRTSILSLQDGVVTMMAEVGIDDKVLATGHAQEKETSSFINKTSFVENCETSAIGRALGILGIGIDTSVASAEEVENAILNQTPKVKITSAVKEDVHLCTECGNEIKDSKKSSGAPWSSKDIAAYTLKRFGRELCAECGKKEYDKNA